MGHFAKIENNKVVNVIIADQEFIDKGLVEGVYLETTPGVVGGIVYQDPPTQPIQDDEVPAEPTPTDLPSVRKNYGGIGMDYNPELDAFIPLQPYPSWTLNETTCQWEAPTPYPDDDGRYTWNEDTLSWIEQEEGI
jgi:hypothetical protein